uniref:Uncharacterized protein n=1 Tax=Arundo donax TaxID=35708 RepID=A0A0A9GQQ8_ARUDO
MAATISFPILLLHSSSSSSGHPSFPRSCKSAVPCRGGGTSKSSASPRASGTNRRSQ